MNKRILALFLTLAMAVGVISSTAAVTKTKKYSPKDSMDHFESVIEESMGAVGDYLNENESKPFNSEDIGTWGYSALYFAEAAFDVFENAIYAEEYPGESEKEDDAEYTTKRTSDYYIYEYNAKFFDEDFEKDSTYKLRTKYYRQFDKLSNEVTNSNYDATSEIIDIVNTEKNIYFQIATLVPSVDEDPSYYSVYRAFAGSGTIYMSYAELSKEELRESRVNSGYETPAKFMFDEGYLFAFDGKSLKVLNSEGEDITFTKTATASTKADATAPAVVVEPAESADEE